MRLTVKNKMCPILTPLEKLGFLWQSILPNIGVFACVVSELVWTRRNCILVAYITSSYLSIKH